MKSLKKLFWKTTAVISCCWIPAEPDKKLLLGKFVKNMDQDADEIVELYPNHWFCTYTRKQLTVSNIE